MKITKRKYFFALAFLTTATLFSCSKDLNLIENEHANLKNDDDTEQVITDEQANSAWNIDFTGGSVTPINNHQVFVLGPKFFSEEQKQGLNIVKEYDLVNIPLKDKAYNTKVFMKANNNHHTALIHHIIGSSSEHGNGSRVDGIAAGAPLINLYTSYYTKEMNTEAWNSSYKTIKNGTQNGDMNSTYTKADAFNKAIDIIEKQAKPGDVVFITQLPSTSEYKSYPRNPIKWIPEVYPSGNVIPEHELPIIQKPSYGQIASYESHQQIKKLYDKGIRVVIAVTNSIELNKYYFHKNLFIVGAVDQNDQALYHRFTLGLSKKNTRVYLNDYVAPGIGIVSRVTDKGAKIIQNKENNFYTQTNQFAAAHIAGILASGHEYGERTVSGAKGLTTKFLYIKK